MSNMTVGGKSSLRAFYDRMGSSSAFISRAKQHAAATGYGVRQGGESLVVGGLLGAASQELKGGLDVDVKGKMKLPIDAALGVVAVGASIALAHEDYSTDLRNVGSSALSIFAFRKTAEFVAKKKGLAPRIAGEIDFGAEDIETDRIVAYAREMGAREMG